MRAFGLILARRAGFLAQRSAKVSLEEVDSNSSSSTGRSKIDTLRIARDGGGGASPAGVGVKLSVHLLKS